MDFPAVDWVIQVDLPEDTDTYIHRVGRTARYKYKGSSLLMVLPSETKFVDKLKRLNIDMKKLKANPNRTLSITSALQRLNAENNDLLHLAQRAFIWYIRSIFKNGDKEVFDVSKIDHELFAQSLGIVTAPVIEFTQEDKNEKKSKLQKLRDKIKEKKLKAQEIPDSDAEEELDEDIEEQEENSQDSQLSDEHHSINDKDQEDTKDDLFVLKRTIKPEDELENEESEMEFESKKVFSKNQLKKIKKGGISQGKNKVYFDADGKPLTSLEYYYKTDTNKDENEDGDPDEYINKVKKSLSQTKDMDAQIAQERLKQKRLKRKRQREEKVKEKKMRQQEEMYEEGEGDVDFEGDEECQPEPPQNFKQKKRFKKHDESDEISKEESSEEPDDL